jgi:hypothetical protein
MAPLGELRDLVVRNAGAGEVAMSDNEALGIRFIAWRHTSEPMHHVYEPVFSLVVQGEKQAVVGDRLFTCSAGHFMVASVDLPLTIRVSVATPEHPFAVMGMQLEPAKVATLLLETASDETLPVEAARRPSFSRRSSASFDSSTDRVISPCSGRWRSARSFGACSVVSRGIGCVRLGSPTVASRRWGERCGGCATTTARHRGSKSSRASRR